VQVADFRPTPFSLRVARWSLDYKLILMSSGSFSSTPALASHHGNIHLAAAQSIAGRAVATNVRTVLVTEPQKCGTLGRAAWEEFRGAGTDFCSARAKDRFASSTPPTGGAQAAMMSTRIIWEQCVALTSLYPSGLACAPQHFTDEPRD